MNKAGQSQKNRGTSRPLSSSLSPQGTPIGANLSSNRLSRPTPGYPQGGLHHPPDAASVPWTTEPWSHFVHGTDTRKGYPGVGMGLKFALMRGTPCGYPGVGRAASSALAIFILLICALLLCIPVGTAHAHPAQGETATIQIVGTTQPTGFLPAILTVHVFDYVIFLNSATPATTYSVSADDGSFSSPAIAPGKQWAVALTTPGTFEYHDTANPPHMVGEIIAVANSVSLLPSPAPDVEATAIAMIQAGKTPPDSLALVTPTPTTVIAHNQSITKPLLSSINPWLMILLIAESTLLLLTVSCIILILRSYRRRLRQLQAKNEAGQPIPSPEKVGMRQKVFARFRHSHEAEDEDDEDYDDEA